MSVPVDRVFFFFDSFSSFRFQECIQRILNRLPNQSIKMRPNLFFINFNRSGDCLFIFLRYIFHGLFFLSFDYGLVTIINQKTDLFQEPSFKMCAIFRTLSLPLTKEKMLQYSNNIPNQKEI